MFRTIAMLAAALLLEGDAGGDDEKAWAERVAPRLSKLIDERIDAAFDRWLEKGKPADQAPAPAPKPADGPPAPAPPAGDPPASPVKPSIMDLVFGRSGS